jgi:uncharacterized protein YceK
MWPARFITLLLAAVTASGCGTLVNLRPLPAYPQVPGEGATWAAPKKIYGGVAFDAHAGAGLLQEATLDPPKGLLGAYVWGVDLPLSAVGDTLTLPVTIRAALQRDAPCP